MIPNAYMLSALHRGVYIMLCYFGGFAVLELDSHPDHNKGGTRPAHIAHVLVVLLARPSHSLSLRGRPRKLTFLFIP